MTKDLKHQLRKYYHDISKALPCFGKSKKTGMDELKENINIYLEENPNATINDITSRFGSAQSFVEFYINSKDIKEIEEYDRKCKRFKKLAIFFSFVVLIVVGLTIGVFIAQKNNTNVYEYTDSVEIRDIQSPIKEEVYHYTAN